MCVVSRFCLLYGLLCAVLVCSVCLSQWQVLSLRRRSEQYWVSNKSSGLTFIAKREPPQASRKHPDPCVSGQSSSRSTSCSVFFPQMFVYNFASGANVVLVLFCSYVCVVLKTWTCCLHLAKGCLVNVCSQESPTSVLKMRLLTEEWYLIVLWLSWQRQSLRCRAEGE